MQKIFITKLIKTEFLLLFFLLPISLLAQLATINLPPFIADDSAKVWEVKTGLAYCEGPVVDFDGNLYFSEQSTGIIWKVTPDNVAIKWRTGVNTPNGLDISWDGYILCCERYQITKIDKNGKVVQTIVQDQSYGNINDLTLSSKGNIFFTNNANDFFFYSPTIGVKRYSGYNVNGIELIEERNCIFLNMCNNNKVVKCSINSDETININSMKTIISNILVPDGITVDSNYNIYIASYQEGKIFVYDSTGKQLGFIELKQNPSIRGNVSNCVFGGSDNKTLYITGNGGAYKINLKIAGRKRPDLLTFVNKYKVFGKNIITFKNSKYSSYNLLGKVIVSPYLLNNNYSIHLSSGIYIISYQNVNHNYKTSFYIKQ